MFPLLVTPVQLPRPLKEAEGVQLLLAGVNGVTYSETVVPLVVIVFPLLLQDILVICLGFGRGIRSPTGPSICVLCVVFCE
jgi:hypothetical protein